ncbi:M20 family metallopeptidase [Roseiconus nitratireducens]|uniref:M20 family metallopeptidase n=1 Tax=Roseiconus nitratireducens TaxID=2605748 RepID=A0A5M6D0G0_9BACT|nr:M20 family metallopeptidase [Roseiconus nitratireducens]KAA5540967.1 M20 family metallopeptidase [Roseiconus nitratireducens]
MDDHSADGSLQSAIATLNQLIAFPSVSSTSNEAITDWVARQLTGLGFSVSRTGYTDGRGISKCNLVAVRHPAMDSPPMTTPPAVNPSAGDDPDLDSVTATGGLAYFCHTDVVPADEWTGPAPLASNDAAWTASIVATPATPGNPAAFQPVVRDDRVYGRGACDMKGSLAAMLTAVARINPSQQVAPIWIVCTADEEIGFEGAKHVARHCPAYRELVQAQPICLIGEPTELDVVYAHKGICGFRIRSRGRAGHSAYDDGLNANERMVPMLNHLLEQCHRTRSSIDLQDTRFDPPTLSYNFGVSDHSNVINITPEHSDAWVSLRTMPGISGSDLVAEAQQEAERLGLSFHPIDGCDPLWTDPSDGDVKQLVGLAGTTARTVCYATDGGVLTELRRRIVFGPGSIHQAHTTDEWISLDQLRRGIRCFEQAVRTWCVAND